MNKRTVLILGLVLLLIVVSVTTAQQETYPVWRFTPYAAAPVHTDQDANSTPTRTLAAGETVTIYTPLVGGSARWWAALDAERTEWVAIAVNGYCPREWLGQVDG